MNLESLLNIFGNQKEGEFEPSVNEGSSERKKIIPMIIKMKYKILKKRKRSKLF